MTIKNRQQHDERGSASVELVVLLPVLFSIVFLALQASLYYYGRTTALAAAETGARALAAENGTTGACRSAAQQLLDRAGDALTNTAVQCSRTTTTATVHVTGDALSVVVGWHQPISQSATLPTERVT